MEVSGGFGPVAQGRPLYPVKPDVSFLGDVKQYFTFTNTKTILDPFGEATTFAQSYGLNIIR